MLTFLVALWGSQHEPLSPVVATQQVAYDADDPAIWVAPDPAKSLILGTDKMEKTGGLYVFDLDGRIVQKVENLDRPNNVDVQQAVRFDDDVLDLAVVTERGAKRLRVFTIDRKSGRLTDRSGQTKVFEDRVEPDAVPMGIGLLKRKDGSLWAIVSPKGGPKAGYLEARPIIRDEELFHLGPATRLGDFSGSGEIESIFADDSSGNVFYSDEGASLCMTTLQGPNAMSTRRFAESGYGGDREGLARHSKFLVSSDQIEGGSRIHVFDLDSLHEVAVLETIADSTDGLDSTDRPLGPKFPRGLLVMMNSRGRNFLLFDWRDVAKRLPID